MNQFNDEDAYHLLLKAGFTPTEIDQLARLRRDYRANIPLDYARLQFVRWLVQTGRLTEQIDEEDASCTFPLEDKPALKMVVASINLKRDQLGLAPSSDAWSYREYH
jgi:hypothetical protein